MCHAQYPNPTTGPKITSVHWLSIEMRPAWMQHQPPLSSPVFCFLILYRRNQTFKVWKIATVNHNFLHHIKQPFQHTVLFAGLNCIVCHASLRSEATRLPNPHKPPINAKLISIWAPAKGESGTPTPWIHPACNTLQWSSILHTLILW